PGWFCRTTRGKGGAVNIIRSPGPHLRFGVVAPRDFPDRLAEEINHMIEVCLHVTANQNFAHGRYIKSTACFLRSARVAYSSAPSCVAASTTRGACPASKASCQRGAQRHQRSPG